MRCEFYSRCGQHDCMIYKIFGLVLGIVVICGTIVLEVPDTTDKNNICDIWFSRVQWGMLQSVASTLTYPTYHDGTRESTCAWQTMACCHLLTRPLMLKFTVSSAILCYSRYAVYNFHHTVYRAALLWRQKMNTRVLVSNHKKTKFKKVHFRNFKIF